MQQFFSNIKEVSETTPGRDDLIEVIEIIPLNEGRDGEIRVVRHTGAEELGVLAGYGVCMERSGIYNKSVESAAEWIGSALSGVEFPKILVQGLYGRLDNLASTEKGDMLVMVDERDPKIRFSAMSVATGSAAADMARRLRNEFCEATVAARRRNEYRESGYIPRMTEEMDLRKRNPFFWYRLNDEWTEAMLSVDECPVIGVQEYAHYSEVEIRRREGSSVAGVHSYLDDIPVGDRLRTLRIVRESVSGYDGAWEYREGDGFAWFVGSDVIAKIDFFGIEGVGELWIGGIAHERAGAIASYVADELHALWLGGGSSDVSGVMAHEKALAA